MKNYFAILLFCTVFSASAQYYQDPARHNGVDRSLTGQMDDQRKAKKQPQKVDIVEVSVQKLTDELTLDSFQAAVITQLLGDNKKEEEKIVVEDIPDESKIEKIIVLREKLNGKIKEILRPDQIEKFDKMGKKKKK
jgi:hypothetical protein